ncbi:MAG: nucleoside diphosphate kinase regulator [Bacteroidales bacterium]
MKNLIISRVDSLRLRDRINFHLKNRGESVREVTALKEELGKAEVVEPEQIPPDVVTMRTTVKLRHPETGKSLEIQLVYPEEADFKQGKISIFAPVASALLGNRKGDTVCWPAPGGMTRMIIEDILYQPEASGDLSL